MNNKLFFGFLLIILSLNSISAKDVYVSAGKKGNGTKENPYGSIADALDMGVYAGDVIHVTEGVYYGKGGSGKWVIDKNNLTLAGGYNKDFSQRNPWKFQSILVRGMDEGALKEAKARNHNKKWGLDLTPTKASYNGKAMLDGEGDHTNTIIDGFIVDGYTRLTYKSNGDLKTDLGPIGTPLISFNKPGCKVRNCVVLNSGGPGIRIGAYGDEKNPDSWAEVSNCVVVNTLMQALDFRVGNLDADKAPDGGYALIKDNTLVFVWSLLGEGYGILIGNQTNLQIENNIIAFATDYGMNNGFGNNKAKLVDNCFFNNMGGVYRYFDTKNKVTVVEDDPTKFKGREAKRKYFLNSNSEGNYTANPQLKPDPDFFEKFTNQIKSEGGGKVVWDDVNQWRSAMGLPLVGSAGSEKKNYAPVYEHQYMLLFSDKVKAGAKDDPSRFPVYQSKAGTAVAKDYVEIDYKDLKDNLGKDVTVSVMVGQKETSGYYVDGITKDQYDCYRTKDMQNFIYLKKGSEALEILDECRKNGESVLLSGTLYDIYANIKMKGKYGIVVDEADYDD